MDFVKNINCKLILAGDFNLSLNTKSVAMLDEHFDNLIKKYNVQSTRTSLYKKNERFADYIFVSHDVNVNNFVVLNENISDHTALVVDIDN